MISTRVAVDADAARTDARDILSDARFRGSSTPKPLRGPLDWIGDRLRGIGNAIADVADGVPDLVWWMLAAALIGVVVMLVVRDARRRRSGGASERVPFGTIGGRRDDPSELEALADAAERSGDFDTAVRLRFRAGLLRLDERGALLFRPSLTTGEVRRLLGSATFDELAVTFEEIAYGGREATPPDASSARDSWRAVLDQVAR